VLSLDGVVPTPSRALLVVASAILACLLMACDGSEAPPEAGEPIQNDVVKLSFRFLEAAVGEAASPSPAPQAVAGEVANPSPAAEAVAEEVASPSPAPEAVAEEVASPSPAPQADAGEVASPSPAPQAVAGEVASPSPAPQAAAEEVASPSPAPQAAAEEVASPSPAPQAATSEDIIILINDYRSENGLEPLQISPALTQAAQWMSEDMASNDYFSHTDSLGRQWFQRMADFGYEYKTFKGETLAAGSTTARKTLDAWRSSPEHNALLLGIDFLAIGAGKAYDQSSTYSWYWVVDLGGELEGGNTAAGEPQ
jgi:uncharacterized protein YkwD